MSSPAINAALSERVVEDVHLVAPFSYSSRLSQGFVSPSSLSTLALHAGFEYAELLDACDENPQLVMASERSWSAAPVTTGQALRAHPVSRFVSHLPVIQLNDNSQRLLNTPQQAREIAVYSGRIDHSALTAVCFEFHAPRVVEAFRRHGVPGIQVLLVDEVLDTLWDTSEVFRIAFREIHGFHVDWPTIKQKALPEFEKREQSTRLASRFAGGILLEAVTLLTQTGRYDNILPDGTVIRKRTQ